MHSTDANSLKTQCTHCLGKEEIVTVIVGENSGKNFLVRKKEIIPEMNKDTSYKGLIRIWIKALEMKRKRLIQEEIFLGPGGSPTVE